MYEEAHALEILSVHLSNNKYKFMEGRYESIKSLKLYNITSLCPVTHGPSDPSAFSERVGEQCCYANQHGSEFRHKNKLELRKVFQLGEGVRQSLSNTTHKILSWFRFEAYEF